MSDNPMRRRGWLTAAAGFGVMGVAGGLAWQTSQRQAKALTDAENQFWLQSFTVLDGAQLTAAAFKGKPLLLNFWATWCPPCVEELPAINAFFNQNKAKGWQVLGLAVDQAGAVRRFLNQTPLDFSIAMAGFPGIDVSKSLGNLTGGLPFTVVFDAAGAVIQRKMGKLNANDLQVWSDLKI